MNDGESSFCGLDKDGKRQKMQEETDRLRPEDERINSEKSDFKSRYTSRSKRQTDDRERTCCYIYIRVDPTLWDVVYKNEGLNVRRSSHSFSVRIDSLPVGKGANDSRHCHISLSDCHRGQCDLSNVEVWIQRRCSLSIYSTHQTHSCKFSHEKTRLIGSLSLVDLNTRRLWTEEFKFERNQHLSIVSRFKCSLDLAFSRELRGLLSGLYLCCTRFRRWNIGLSVDGECCFKWVRQERHKRTNKHRSLWSSDSRGGICEKPAKDIYEGQRVMKTLNTGMITVINHNSRTSSLMTELTFAHEVGHNLGAEVRHSYLWRSKDGSFSHCICSTMTRNAAEMWPMVITSCIDEQRPVSKITTISSPIAAWRKWDPWSLPLRINWRAKSTV